MSAQTTRNPTLPQTNKTKVPIWTPLAFIEIGEANAERLGLIRLAKTLQLLASGSEVVDSDIEALDNAALERQIEELQSQLRNRG
jgi:hypothetical protein